MAEVEKLIEIYQRLEDAGLMVIAGKKDSAELMVSHDVVPVVRCKDCKHNEDCIRRIQFWGRDSVLELNTTEYHPIDFCSYGERRTDEGNT